MIHKYFRILPYDSHPPQVFPRDFRKCSVCKKGFEEGERKVSASNNMNHQHHRLETDGDSFHLECYAKYFAANVPKEMVIYLVKHLINQHSELMSDPDSL